MRVCLYFRSNVSVKYKLLANALTIWTVEKVNRIAVGRTVRV